MEIARTMEEELKIPGWLSALINAEFLKRKGIQQDDLKYCCVDCASNSLTETETFNDHNNHRVLQAFKASGHYGYQLKDIQSLQQHCCLDFDIVSGVCVYSINKLPILYPKSRVKPESEFSRKISSTKCCVTCGWTLIKDSKASFCSILCKLINQFGENPAPVSPLKDQDYDQDRVFLEEEGEQRTLLLKFKIRANNNNNNGRTNLNEKVKVGVNGGGIKNKKPLEKRKKLADSITEEIEVINGKKISSLKRKKKLESLVSIAKEEEDEEIKLQGFRKRSRKGVHRKPCRAPLF